MPAKITQVTEQSPAWRSHIRPGDVLLEVEGHPIKDCLDYRFYSTQKKLHIKLQRGEKVFRLLVIKNDPYEDIGLDFETYLMDKAQCCHNRCIFCFIDQLPRGMRRTVYFKDDDTRLSFLTGNYVTLTNVSQGDLDRIIEQRISPINISVQATDPELRIKMLHNKRAGQIMDQIDQLAHHHIEMNCQIVLCKDINDGPYLEKSIRELCAYYPHIHSISVVPVGLSKFREKLYPLEPFQKEDARKVIAQVERLQQENLEKLGSRVVFLGDEFYLKAELPIPSPESYEGYPQLENGVGLMASMREEFDDGLARLTEEDMARSNAITLATGAAAYRYICNMVDDLKEKCHNLEVNTYCITNDFFGHTINVVGLVTGQDLVNQLKDKEIHGTLMISSSMLRDEGDMFLDDMTPAQVEEALQVKLITCNNNGYDFIDRLLGR